MKLERHTFTAPDGAQVTINYLPRETRIRRRPLSWQRRGLQETTSGYGAKLTTELQAEYNGRWYRVYCMCYGNSGSCYILSKGQQYYLHDTTRVDENL